MSIFDLVPNRQFAEWEMDMPYFFFKLSFVKVRLI